MATSRSMGRKSPAKKTNAAKGVDRKYLCPYCNKEKSSTEFYMSSDPLVLTGLTTMCKSCAEKIARNWNDTLQQYGDCTKDSIQSALERLDKPWLENIYISRTEIPYGIRAGSLSKQNWTVTNAVMVWVTAALPLLCRTLRLLY